MKLFDRLLKECKERSATAGLSSAYEMVPLGGEGERVCPPTYPGETKNHPPRYHYENRYIDGAVTGVVVLDSFQSQANRIEKVLEAEWLAGKIGMPMVSTFVEVTNERHHVTSLPHRLYDSYIRDSVSKDGKTRTFESGWFKPMLSPNQAEVHDGIFRHNPAGLVFGYWGNSSDPRLSRNRLCRLYEGQVFGLVEMDNAGQCVTQAKRSGGRICPNNLPTFRGMIVKPDRDVQNWTFDLSGKTKGVRLSEVNHGNVPTNLDKGIGGVSCRSIRGRANITLAGLFQIAPYRDDQKDQAIRAAVLATALHGHVAYASAPNHLRSGCTLVPKLRTKLGADKVDRYVVPVVCEGAKPEEWALTVDETRAVYMEAVEWATKLKLIDPKLHIELKAGKVLEGIVKAREQGLVKEDDEDKTAA